MEVRPGHGRGQVYVLALTHRHGLKPSGVQLVEG